MADNTPLTADERLERLERLVNRLVDRDINSDRDGRDRPRRRGRRNVLGLEARMPRRREMEDAIETLSMGIVRFDRDDDRDDDW